LDALDSWRVTLQRPTMNHDRKLLGKKAGHLVLGAFPGRPFRAENGVVVARRCRRSLVLRGRHLDGM
jgi:hypothetical protein